jgi:hypothetical protein
MNSLHHAVVEVSADEITLRVNDRWLRFTASTMQHSQDAPQDFTLTEDGSVRIGDGPAEEMDMAAERLAREILHTTH